MPATGLRVHPSMSARIGIAIGSEALRAVCVRGGKVLWAAQSARAPEQSLAACIEEILAGIPTRRLRRMPVDVAVGPHAAQVKLLAGLPPVSDPRVLASLVRESSASFFLRNGSALVTTGVRVAGEGRVWAAAIEAETIEAIRAACRSQRLKLRSIAPTAAVLPLAARNERFTWRDGEVGLEIARSGPDLELIRRLPATLLPPDAPVLEPVEALASFGPDAWRYADAYGATLVSSNASLALGPDGVRPLADSLPVRRLALPAMIAAVGVIALALSPLRAQWTAERARAALDATRATETWRDLLASAAEIEHVTGVLNEIAAFTASRPDRAGLLGDLALAMPDGSALLRLEVDGTEGKLVAVTPQASALLMTLRSLPRFSSVDLVGEVTRQTVGGQELERVMIEFRLKDAVQPRRDAVTGHGYR